MDIKHILVPSDFSDNARHALSNALGLASAHGAKITLLHIVTVYEDDPYNPDQSFPDLKEYYKQLEERAGAHFEEAVSSTALKYIPIEYVIRRGFSPYEEILSFAAEKDIDLIALGRHSRKPLVRFFLGSVAEKIVHHAECPVLTVRIRDDQVQVPTFNTILVPVDFSDQSERALSFAASVLQPKTLHVLHVVEDTVHPAFSSESNSILEIMPQIMEKSQVLTEKMIKKNVQDTMETYAVVKQGRIATTIDKYAEEKKCDLVVMGTHGMNAIGQIMIGSQANRVIRKSTCPVITIK